MATPSPPSSPSSSSNPNSTATPPPPPPPPRDSPTPAPPPLSPPRNTVVALAASSSPVARKPQPLLWTHDETLILIDAYKEKWYSIGRGPLKSGHWEEIAVAVSARSGVDRSATQCRHKIEKMRKRFRAERQRVGSTSTWPYYLLMQELENNPTTPISARPLTRLPPTASNIEEDEEGDADNYDDEDNEEDEDEDRQNKSRSINYILRRPGTVNRFAAAAAAAAASGVGDTGLNWGYEERARKTKKRKVVVEEEGERGWRGARAVAAEIRTFAESLMAMEKRKMEFAREMERRRVDMEMRRLDLIKTSQSRLLHFVTNVFDSP